ncbi:MAG: hypothetical protein J7545_15660 [Roseofilum sp. SBFL]|uniref:hypothetical protein n=1 Tax=Roseofilum sp. SBFL TaxID=2821496 RepID=UPI001B22B103|nr:hypothetical protein [Roseofilum sp. SBFL]MBP0043384.1 hypothetical protein [Roseofilum sp. SBFL]
MPGIEAAQGSVVPVAENASERERVLVAWFQSRDPGQSGTRKLYGGLVELFVEKIFNSYFNVPVVAQQDDEEVTNYLKKTNAYTSTQRAGLEFTEQGVSKQVAGFVGTKNLALKRKPAGKRIIVPSQQTRLLTRQGTAKKYYVSKTASCTVPKWFNVLMCLQLMGTMLKAKKPKQIRIAGKRYRWRKFPVGRATDPGTGLIQEAGAFVLSAEFNKSTHLPFVPDDNILETYTMNM